MDIRSLIRTIPNFPKEGIMFRDITTLISDSAGFKWSIENFKERYINSDIDVIVGVEARGFIFGAALAFSLGKGFVPIRKKGKLPGDTYEMEYQLEYGSDVIEIHKNVLKRRAKVLLIDDLMATGGTALGSIALVEKAGGQVKEFAVVVDLPDLKGGKILQEKGYNFFSQCEFAGD